jgi:siroheme synthase (precorrin-2 oxidase/ferrochelatase)
MAMPDEPVFLVDLDMDGLSCLVVGRGFTANRRAHALRNCGADVTVVPALSYRRGQAADYDVVVTCDRRVDDQVARDAWAAGVRVHIVGDPEHSSVLLPRPHLRQLAS